MISGPDLPTLPRAKRYHRMVDYIRRLDDARAKAVAALQPALRRDVRVYLDHVERSLSQRAISRAHGIHYSTVCKIIAAIEDLRDDPDVEAVIAEVRAEGGQ